jgi:lysozyme
MSETRWFWLGVCVVGLGACGGGTADNVGSTEAEVRSCPGGSTVEGVDVSKYEGDIDWNAVKQSGRAFAFIRVSDGLTHYDAYFDTNWSNAQTAGVYRGAYQFFRPNEDATAQADLLLSHGGGNGEIPPVLDVEVSDGAAGATIRAGVNKWSNHIQQATGRTPIIYTAPGFWASVGGGHETDTLWVANWGVSCPSMPSSWTHWSFWQYSDHGSVPGISGGVDINRFNGSLADLAAFAGASPGGGGDAGVDSGGGGGDAGADSGGGSSGGGPACSSDGDCNPGSDGSGKICVHHACVAGCNADWQCPGSTTCVGGQCQ